MSKKLIVIVSFLLVICEGLFGQSQMIEWDNNQKLPETSTVDDIRTIKEPSEHFYSRIFPLNNKLVYVIIRSTASGDNIDRITVFSQENDSCRCVATGLTSVYGVTSAFYYSDRGLWLNDKKVREVVDVQDSIYSDFNDKNEIRWFLAKFKDRLFAIDFRVSVDRERSKLLFWAKDEIIGELRLEDL